MRNLTIGLIALMGVGIFVGEVHARQIIPLSNHGPKDINDHCTAINGIHLSTDDGGYGCLNPNCDGKGGNCIVGCDKSGSCVGEVPRDEKPGVSVNDLLNPNIAVKLSGSAADAELLDRLSELGRKGSQVSPAK